MYLRHYRAFLLLAILLIPGISEAKPPLVMELFTSQGCASCPAADIIFGELIEDNRDVIALAFHVDYWDRRGWKDPFSLAASTARQDRYADALRSNRLFTPQVMVGGRESFIGTRKGDIHAALQTLRRAEQPYLPVSLSLIPKGLQATITPDAEGNIRGEADIWFVAYEDSSSTRVKRGENWGKTLKNHHSVTQVLYLGKWNENPVSLDMDFVPDADYAAILVQRPDGGKIIGAAQLSLPR